jgi:hypothetical protein
MTEATERSPEAVKDRDRIVNLSDGVFAIAILCWSSTSRCTTYQRTL